MTTDSKVVPFRKGANEGKADTTLADFYARQADSRNTVKAYAWQWSRFEEWCHNHGVESMPASDDTVRAYIADLASEGKAVSTIDQAVAAIRHSHRGMPDPIGGETLRTRKGIRRAVGVAPKRKARPVLDDELIAMFDACPDTVSGIRERALLAIGWCAALRCSELVSLSVNDVPLSPQGIQVTIRRSKTDQDGAGATVPIQRASGVGSKACEALQEWLDVLKQSGIEDGPLFRGVDRHGNMKPSALTSQSVNLIIVKAAKNAGIDPAGFSGHSLRAGLATSAAMRGVGERKIMETTRHTNLRTVHGYIRQATIWETGALSMLF